MDNIISTARMVRGYMDANNVSVKALSEASGLSERTIYRFLGGKCRLSKRIALGVNSLIPEISLEFLMTYDAKYQLQNNTRQDMVSAAKKPTRSSSPTVRKNVTIPRYLNDRAEQAGINFSQLLQAALKQQLGC